LSKFSTENVFGGFFEKLTEVFEEISKDLGTLTVVTTTGSVSTTKKKSTGADIFDIEETGISAKTIIEIDGDIIVKLPVKDVEGKPVELDERILKIHEENVAMAMENWRIFITTLVDIAKDLKGLLAPS
jgi:hypothetical protein